MKLPVNYNTLDKVDKYILRFANSVDFCKTSASRYYHFNSKILRVSDHIGNNSTGCYHIIIKPNGYLIHHPLSGNINIVTYEKVKEFIRVFAMTSIESVPCKRMVDEKKEKNNPNISELMGVPISVFTPGQLESLSSLLGAIKKKLSK